MFKVIGGTSGKAKGEDVVVAVCNYIFANDFMSKITWTGRSGSKEVKRVPLKKYGEIVKIITDLSLAADEKFSEKQCEHELVYSVFKYAYRRQPSIQDSVSDSSSNCSSAISVSTDSTDSTTGQPQRSKCIDKLQPVSQGTSNNVEQHQTSHFAQVSQSNGYNPFQPPQNAMNGVIPHQYYQPYPHHIPYYPAQFMHNGQQTASSNSINDGSV